MKVTWHYSAIVAILIAGMSLYVESTFIPYERNEAARSGWPHMLSDAYPPWYGAHELLLHRRDPYSREVTAEIQAVSYGHPIDRRRPGEPIDEQRFAYPAYVAFLFAPTVNLSFPDVQIGMLCLLVALTGASVVLWMRYIFSRQVSLFEIAIVTLFVLTSPAAVRGLELQQLSLFVAALIAAVAVSLARERLFLAGVLVGIASIKPQMIGLLTVWLLAWAANKWTQRRNFLLGFLLSMGILTVGAALFLLTWPMGWIETIGSYSSYRGQSLVSMLARTGAGAESSVVTWLAVSIIAVLICTSGEREHDAKSVEFIWMFSLTLALEVLFMPSLYPAYNYVLLIPGILLLVRSRQSLSRTAFGNAVLVLGAGVLFWPWLSATALTVAAKLDPAVHFDVTLPIYGNAGLPIVIVVGFWILRHSRGHSVGSSTAKTQVIGFPSAGGPPFVASISKTNEGAPPFALFAKGGCWQLLSDCGISAVKT